MNNRFPKPQPLGVSTGRTVAKNHRDKFYNIVEKVLKIMVTIIETANNYHIDINFNENRYEKSLQNS